MFDGLRRSNHAGIQHLIVLDLLHVMPLQFVKNLDFSGFDDWQFRAARGDAIATAYETSGIKASAARYMPAAEDSPRTAKGYR